MSEHIERLREALTDITDAVIGVINEYEAHRDVSAPAMPQEMLTCTPKTLPKHLLVKAAETAIKINPVNAPAFGPLADMGPALMLDPARLAVLTSKYWGPAPRILTVSFMESTPADLRARLIRDMNAWTRTVNISFAETQGTGNVRISRGPGGYWSYLGTDIRLIPSNRPTMNLQGFTMQTPESEFRRVVPHEVGHSYGFPHEHQRRAIVERIDPAKAYIWFLRTYGWDKRTVDQQVLTSLDERSIMGTPADQESIMSYQLPGSITYDGKPIFGGVDINQTDYAFAGRIYPRLAAGSPPAAAGADEWDESEDVKEENTWN